MKSAAVRSLTLLFLVILFFAFTGAFSRLNLNNMTGNGAPTAAVSVSVTPEVLGAGVTAVLKNSNCMENGPLPDIACTPGAADGRVTQDNISSTICTSGYTRTVRPPVSVTEKIKKERMEAYGDSGSPRDYELDHLIPLELGGCPDCIANLWPEPADPTPGFHEKDKVENYLHEQVCSGKIPLSEAQKEISGDWLTVYNSLNK